MYQQQQPQLKSANLAADFDILVRRPSGKQEQVRYQRERGCGIPTVFTVRDGKVGKFFAALLRPDLAEKRLAAIISHASDERSGTMPVEQAPGWADNRRTTCLVMCDTQLKPLPPQVGGYMLFVAPGDGDKLYLADAAEISAVRVHVPRQTAKAALQPVEG